MAHSVSRVRSKKSSQALVKHSPKKTKTPKAIKAAELPEDSDEYDEPETTNSPQGSGYSQWEWDDSRGLYKRYIWDGKSLSLPPQAGHS
jgi:hypothetical protein